VKLQLDDGRGTPTILGLRDPRLIGFARIGAVSEINEDTDPRMRVARRNKGRS
jgi:hypothetical protein